MCNTIQIHSLIWNLTGINHTFPARYHNHNGTLSVERVPHKSPLVYAFLEAGKAQGYSEIDYNDPDQNSQGFSRIQANMHGGRRINGANAFLRPIRWDKLKTLKNILVNLQYLL